MSLQATQFSLFDPLPALNHPKVSREATIQERFESFDKANPHVYRALRKLAFTMLEAGVQQYGMKGLYERLRWEYTIQTQGEPFRLSNDFTSRYARKLMTEEPRLSGFFDLRELRSE